MSLIQTLNMAKAKGKTPDQIVLTVANPWLRAITAKEMMESEHNNFVIMWNKSYGGVSYVYKDGCEAQRLEDGSWVTFYAEPRQGLVGRFENAPVWTKRQIISHGHSNSTTLLFIPVES